MAAGIFVIVAAKAHHSAAPHYWRAAAGLRHQLRQKLAVPAHLRVWNGAQVFGDAELGGFSSIFDHAVVRGNCNAGLVAD